MFILLCFSAARRVWFTNFANRPRRAAEKHKITEGASYYKQVTPYGGFSHLQHPSLSHVAPQFLPVFFPPAAWLKHSGGDDAARPDSRPLTNPLEIYRYRDGLYAVDLLTAAIVHLDFFSWLSKNPSEATAICGHFGTAPRPTDVMLTLFTAQGFIASHQGTFQITELGKEHLTQDSPWNLGPYYASLKDRPVTKDFLTVLKTDKPANWGGAQDALDWHKAMESEAFANSFTAGNGLPGAISGAGFGQRSRPARTRAIARYRRRLRHLLLLAAGASSDLRATVFDQTPVDKIASKLVVQRGFQDRIRVQAGDMFKDPLPNDCDVHLAECAA